MKQEEETNSATVQDNTEDKILKKEILLQKFQRPTKRIERTRDPPPDSFGPEFNEQVNSSILNLVDQTINHLPDDVN